MRLAFLPRLSKQGIEVSLLLWENPFVEALSHFGNFLTDL